MGNVQAQGVPPPPTTVPPPTAPPPSSSGQFTPPPNSTTQPAGKVSNVKLDLPANPGPLEELHKRTRELMPMMFEGGRIIISKGLSNTFQIMHTLNISNDSSNGYRFGATYVAVGTPPSTSTNAATTPDDLKQQQQQQQQPPEPTLYLTGDTDPSGNLNAHAVCQLSDNLKGKLVSQVQKGKFVATQLTGEYRGLNYTGTLTGANIDVNRRSGVIVAQYLQNVRERLALGAECIYRYGPQVPEGANTNLSLAARYTADQYVVAGTLGPMAAHLSYYLRTNETTQVGVEVQTNFRIGESISTIAYQMDLPKANLVFRGMVDSTWTVGAVLEKKLAPLPFTFSLSAMLNHEKGASKFGMGLLIG